MKYTKEIPTKPGWYWVRPRLHTPLFKLPDPILCQIRMDGQWLDEKNITIIIHNQWNDRADDRFEYAGPIEEPEE